jgi:hypothetical protein
LFPGTRCHRNPRGDRPGTEGGGGMPMAGQVQRAVPGSHGPFPTRLCGQRRSDRLALSAVQPYAHSGGSWCHVARSARHYRATATLADLPTADPPARSPRPRHHPRRPRPHRRSACVAYRPRRPAPSRVPESASRGPRAHARSPELISCSPVRHADVQVCGPPGGRTQNPRIKSSAVIRGGFECRLVPGGVGLAQNCRARYEPAVGCWSPAYTTWTPFGRPACDWDRLESRSRPLMPMSGRSASATLWTFSRLIRGSPTRIPLRRALLH